MKKRAKNTSCDIKIIANGIDSLYLFLDCETIINWEFIQKEVQRYPYNEPLQFRRLTGRFYVKDSEGRLKELQSPYISKSEVKEILKKVNSDQSNGLMKLLRSAV